MSFKKLQLINPNDIGSPEVNHIYLGRDNIGLWEKYDNGIWRYIITGSTMGDGTSGSSGKDGKDGIDGNFYGSSGTSGQQGTSGTSGISGSSGKSGTNGVSGTGGSSGTSGFSGTSGSSGTSGLTGSSGSSGISSDGSSGTSGITGSSGTSGVGSSGTSGQNGAYGGASRLWRYTTSDSPIKGYFTTNSNNLSLINSFTINIQDYDEQYLDQWLSGWTGGLLKIEKWHDGSVFGIYHNCVSTPSGIDKFIISSSLINCNSFLVPDEIYVISFIKTISVISKGNTFMSPNSASLVHIWRAPFSCKVTNLIAYRNGGNGAVVNAQNNGADLRSVDLSLTSADSWVDGGTLQNTVVAAGNSISVELVSVDGTPTYVTIQLDILI